MMDPWMNSLSEDWVSEPRSESASAPRTPPSDAQHESSSIAPSKNSGHPSHGSGGSDTVLENKISRKPAMTSTNPDEVDRSVLAERSLNQRPCRSQSSATHSGTVQRHGTTSRKPPSRLPVKVGTSMAGGEWRSRLLGEGGMYSNSHDLFSPSKLETMFRAPGPQPLPQRSRNAVQSSPYQPQSATNVGGKNGRSVQTPTSLDKAGLGYSPKPSSPMQDKKPMQDESRKGSVQTRDFLNEAERVMEFIRAQGRPQPDHTGRKRPAAGSPDISDVEEEDTNGMAAEQRPVSIAGKFPPPPVTVAPVTPGESTNLSPFNQLRLQSKAHQLDPSAAFPQDVHDKPKSSKAGGREPGEDLSAVNYELEIRITDPPCHLAGNPGSPTSAARPTSAGKTMSDSAPHVSNPSLGASSSRTVHTGSSSRSDGRIVIAPQAVSHLVSGEVAGMTFDHHKQAWIKRKLTPSDHQTDTLSNGEESTDDPLQNIPDLTVNEIAELEIIKRGLVGTASETEPETEAENNNDRPYESSVQHLVCDNVSALAPLKASSNQMHPDDRPLGRPEAGAAQVVVSESSHAIDTHERPSNSTPQVPYELPGTEEDVEAEIQAHEGRRTPNPPNSARRQRRDITITFSSPLVSHSFPYPVHSASAESDDTSRDGSPLADHYAVDPHVNGHQSLFTAYRNTKVSDAPMRSCRKPSRTSRRISLGGAILAEIHGSSHHDNESFAYERAVNQDATIRRRPTYDVSAVASDHRAMTPALAAKPQQSSKGRCSNITFYLSPLPDFTVNQADERYALEVSNLGKHKTDAHVKTRARSLSHTTGALLRKLTDVEPYEPYWDFIRQLDISNADLTGLNGLAEYCARVEKLDASNNRVAHLHGVPSTVRFLKLTNNCISSLTAWGHLKNIQYLDISRNEIDNLRALRVLIHLRELRAEENSISSLEGILELDGLMKLDLGQNALESLDFADAALYRLTELNVQCNMITRIQNLQRLPRLIRLDIGDNLISDLTEASLAPLSSLQSLHMNRNHLKTLNIGMFPALRSLYLDDNRIEQLPGLSSAAHLECLSLRSQSTDSSADSSAGTIWDECYELHRLNLSGNASLHLNTTLDFLSLQHLELASSGFRSLPSSFGRRLSNVRTLNLNFNALKDVTPLAGIVRLTKLMLFGNRISRLRKTVHMLSGFRTLKDLDIRHNPLTHGFYAPVQGSGKTRGEFEFHCLDDSTDDNEQFDSPGADPEVDAVYYKRLDVETKLRRKIHNIFFANCCKSLHTLDGLPFEREKVLQYDEHWERLVALRVLPDPRLPADEVQGKRGAIM